MQDTPIYQVTSSEQIEELLSSIPIAKARRGYKYRTDKDGKKIKYLDVITAFDIETTTEDLSETDTTDLQAWMYIWQFQLGDLATFIGRTWDEWWALVYLINQHLQRRGEAVRILTYVHKLGHEFQYLSAFWNFGTDDVFVMKERVPLTALMDRIELRCSEQLSNYSLAQWCKSLETPHKKIENYNYKKIRYPWTELTAEELRYAVTDVICIVECVQKMMEMENDIIYTIPYTLAGYVRRKVRSAMWYWSKEGIQAMQPTYEQYKRLVDAFRGGDWYVNSNFNGVILDDVYSYDISSSYPDVALHDCMPMSEWMELKPNMTAVKEAIESKKAVVMRIGFKNIHLKPKYKQIPYIPFVMGTNVKHCLTQPIDAVEDENGRLLSAYYFEMAITDVDYQIIDKLYDWEDDTIYWAMAARYGYIPQPLAQIIVNYYKQKTRLKGDPDKGPEYDHTKRLLNSGCYGIMAQRTVVPAAQKIIWKDNAWKRDLEYDEEEEYYKRLKKAFVNFAWGVFIPAFGRLHLLTGIMTALAEDPDWCFVYADTDSVKSREPLDFSKYNEKRIAEARRSGAVADDINGDTHYIGVYEYEGKGLFRNFGIKKYVSGYADKLKIACSGLPKEKGSQIINATPNGILDFDEGFIFRDSGKLEYKYNDNVNDTIEIDGHVLRITRNAAFVDSEYCISSQPGYADLVEVFKEFLDTYSEDDV